MRRLALSFLFVLFSFAASAALHFPALTGRVVDDAHLLSPHGLYQLNEILAAYEAGSSNQVVVVTLPSLQGTSIEDYGYQLGRYWGIGKKKQDNGVLLIVAPHERKVRIEVGYGLEGVLTDAVSSQIITGIIEPDFRSGNMEGGILDGAQAIINALGGRSAPLIPVQQYQQTQPASGFQTLLAIIFMILFFSFAIRHPFLALLLMNSGNRFGSSSSGNWSGGGFTGGGGSFGGGGASGSW